MKATFENSVDVLVKAYMNDTLVHGNCYACAVGNLVAASCGFKYINKNNSLVNVQWEGVRYPGRGSDGWGSVFTTSGMKQRLNPEYYTGSPKKQIDSTGYSLCELMKIEFAFETARSRSTIDDSMFNGLLAVVDVLAEIHGVDLSVKQAAIGQFEEIHATK